MGWKIGFMLGPLGGVLFIGFQVYELNVDCDISSGMSCAKLCVISSKHEGKNISYQHFKEQSIYYWWYNSKLDNYSVYSK